ncbi:hypothetical protein P344_03740 [Spiroplasma mirum ATCC 29335]|uniref:Uncharacterized protein n=1 Tax=Spiroplasma mirum ATCC 29335 TaxID=838561 RepID=W0GQZ3_9MOLU|nr:MULTISPECIES: ribosome biogenesis GTPase YqeH [Spiroplasma]AHF61054.1 putative GTPase [Spiroplasma mirum ATCC 29335]AHI58088.1 hypothetical protein P344_03740 [Spiroplasma mirum ATCC 29335]AKM53151.1 GTP-binding protein YqeH [Spiroplasma atrichopogonis]
MTSYNNKKCIGCGVVLQTSEENHAGFAKNIEQDYCLRCFRLINYNEIIDYDVDPHQFLVQLKNNINLHHHYFYVLDIYDLPGTRNFTLEEIIQHNEITLIINKVDLVNKLINEQKIISYVKSIFSSAIINRNIKKIILMSALKNYHVDELYQYITHQTKDLYVVGCSNTGKSSILNCLIKLVNRNNKPIVVSNHFGTTLDNISLNFNLPVKIYDTPGVINTTNLLNYVNKNNYKKLLVNKILRPITFQLNAEQTIFYEGLASFTYLAGFKTSFHFYKNNNIILHRTKYQNQEQYWKNNLNKLSLQLNHYDDMQITEITISQADNYSLWISGLGWITFQGIVGQKLLITTNKNIKITLAKRFI